MPDTREALHDAFTLTEIGPGRYTATSVGDPETYQVVYGGQLLAQMILASDDTAEGKRVASLHAIFARAASPAQPVEIDVDTIHDGRSMGSQSVVVHQGDRICAQGLVLRAQDVPDLIRHQPDAPDVDGPGASPPARQAGLAAPGCEVRVVGGADTADADDVGPAELLVWVKLPPAGDSPALGQALLAYGTDGFLIGTAMRPHSGVGQSMAHRTLATGVVSHTLTFHEPVPTDRWLLMAHEGASAGRGVAYGRAHVFTEDGLLVASFVQESMIKAAG
jgi:acyl-CoA thioesterase II